TASSAEEVSIGWPLTTCKFWMVPSLPINACSTTVPCTRACRARGGYIGCTLWINNPCETPWETRTRCGVAALGTTVGVLPITLPSTPPMAPPGTPPGTPPTTPTAPVGGGSSSLIISIFFGIAVGVRNWPLSNSVWGFVICTGTAAGGGGGGGGGGGATRNVISCCLGSASVKINGNNTRTPINKICSTNEMAVVAPRFVLSLPPDSTRLSSNMACSPLNALIT